MLVLGRKIGQRLLLYRDGKLIARVMPVYVEQGKVGIGVEADRSVVVVREEVQNRRTRATRRR